MNNEKDFSYEITKKNLIKEVNNCYCHNFYYLVYGKIFNKDKTRYRKFKFVCWFDIFDVQEFYEDKETITKEDIKIYSTEYSVSTLESFICNVKTFDDKEHLQEFYNYCNETINDFNRK